MIVFPAALRCFRDIKSRAKIVFRRDDNSEVIIRVAEIVPDLSLGKPSV